MITLTILTGPDAGKTLTPTDDPIVIGRGGDCTVILHDGAIGRQHCTLTRQGTVVVLTDLESKNGTFVNTLDTRVRTRTLTSGDVVLLGRSSLRIEFAGAAADGATSKQAGLLLTRETALEADKLGAIRQPEVPIVISVVSGPDRGMVYSPASAVISIGRAATCTVVLHDIQVSRTHASIKREAGKYRLHDEHSDNGVFLRSPEARIFHADLSNGDIIYLGQTQLRVEMRASKPAVAAASDDATMIVGNLGGKDLTFTLSALAGRSVRQTAAVDDATVASPVTPVLTEEVAPVAPAADAAGPRVTLRVIEGKDAGTVLEPPPGAQRFTLGRTAKADLRLQDRGVSQVHLTMEIAPTSVVLTDSGSTNGTFVNQGTERVSRVELQGGEEIRLGETRMVVDITWPGEATVMVAGPLPARSPDQSAGAAPASSAHAAPNLPSSSAPTEPVRAAVQSRSAAFKERLEKIQRGVGVRPFTMPGTPRQWAALLLMLLAAAGSYGFIALGRPLAFSAGPLHADHQQWEAQCVTCHPNWGVQPVNATCVTIGCHIKTDALHVRADVRDDCVSCHSEHRGRAFNITGGATLCWSCHAEGIGTRRYAARPLAMYFTPLATPEAAESPTSRAQMSRVPAVNFGTFETTKNTVIDAVRLHPAPSPAGRQLLLRQSGAQPIGLKYGHARHDADTLRDNKKILRCQECHLHLPDGQDSAFPTHPKQEADTPAAQPSQVEQQPSPFPTHAECLACHKEVVDRDPHVARKSASAQCLKCHTRPEGGVPYVRKAPVFINFLHADHDKSRCEQCHFGVTAESEYTEVLRSATLYPLPMEACYSCHEQRKVTTGCLDCHRAHHSAPLPMQQAKGWFDAVSFGGLLLALVGLVAGAGAYTYLDMRLARNWLHSLEPPPEEPPPAVTPTGKVSPVAVPPAGTSPPAGSGGILAFPVVDADTCISCKSCYESCPTKVLAGDPVTHKSIVVNPKACTALAGCMICQNGCPTGAIRVTAGPVEREVERAHIDEHNESNLSGLFLVGEVVGAALIKKAVNQGDRVVRYIHTRKLRVTDAPYDVIIVGAGPGGLGAGLEAKRLGLRYLILERATVASTIRDYPRDKAVLAEPVMLGQYGLLPMRDDQKESLIAAWEEVIQKSGLQVNEREEVTIIEKTDTLFTVTTGKGSYQGAYVVLAIGTRGNPNKLGARGEDLPKVAYNLIDAADFRGKKVLVVGGGDSAIEAAVALSKEEGAVVTVSYRQGAFSRAKERNVNAIKEQEKAGRLTVILNSTVTEITETQVTLKIGEEQRVWENDAIFALVGGQSPNAWLAKIGVTVEKIKEIVGPQW